MLSELREDNVLLTARLREAHEVADELRDIATSCRTLHQILFMKVLGEGSSPVAGCSRIMEISCASSNSSSPPLRQPASLPVIARTRVSC